MRGALQLLLLWCCIGAGRVTYLGLHRALGNGLLGCSHGLGILRGYRANRLSAIVGCRERAMG